MEFDDLSEKMQGMARRTAAAFELVEWELVNTKWDGGTGVFRGRTQNEIVVEYELRDSGQIESVSLGGSEYLYRCVDEERGWVLRYTDDCPYPGVMARGLYRAGCIERGVWFHLNRHLSAHERLELRLSMPREFWRQTWQDE